MKILSVVATRPNFIKIAPFIRAIEKEREGGTDLTHVLVHTGQHYDNNMSASFFDEFQLPKPDYNLGIGSGTHAEQDGKTMLAFEQVLLSEKPDWVVVVGDVNATMSTCVTAKKMNFRVCHIEAGIRSFDRSMPEELNRIITDSIADLLLTPDELAIKNLLREGRKAEDIAFVGNVMIDTLDWLLPNAEKLTPKSIIEQKKAKSYGEKSFRESGNLVLITLHRPSNVDVIENLTAFLDWIERKTHCTFLWVLHPRTSERLKNFNLQARIATIKQLVMLEALTYTETLTLNLNVRTILTDSGGLQEEACVIGTPFLVLRQQTERPSTLIAAGGTGSIAGNTGADFDELFEAALKQERKAFRPHLWDGKTAERCLQEILSRS